LPDFCEGPGNARGEGRYAVGKGESGEKWGKGTGGTNLKKGHNHSFQTGRARAKTGRSTGEGNVSVQHLVVTRLEKGGWDHFRRGNLPKGLWEENRFIE